MAIRWIGSPNKDKGREGDRPEAIQRPGRSSTLRRQQLTIGMRLVQ